MAFSVVFTGELREGYSRRSGIDTLSQRFSLGFEEIKSLLTGKRQTVKHAENRQQAEKVVRALWNGGWHCELMQGDQLLFRTGARPEQTTEPVAEPVPEPQSEPANKPVQAPPEKPAGSGVAEAAPTDEKHACSVRSVDNSFSVDLPGGWQECEGLNPQALLQAGDTRRHHYLVVLRQWASELPETLELADYCAAQLQQCIDKVAEGHAGGEPYPLSESSLPSCAVEMTARVGGMEIQYLIASLRAGGSFYTLFLWCERGEFERRRAEFVKIVGGFRLLNGTRIVEERPQQKSAHSAPDLV